MDIKLLWPGKTKNAAFRDLQAFYLKRITALASCRIVETPEAKGLAERFGAKIKEIEARGLEKHLNNAYIVCLFDGGQEMTSVEFARFLERAAAGSARTVAFVVGGFLGIDPGLMDRADARISLSRMTLSHELCRIVLMEQIYRSISILKGRQYAK
jgi:23S rRNA (pseudouridine1915-N3)-methyltransferase